MTGCQNRHDCPTII